MNSSMRPVLLVAIASVLALCVFGLHFACSPVDLSEIRRNEELDQSREATFRRVEARRRVVREVIDQRCTLAEAIEQDEELDREVPDYIVDGRRWGSNKEERYRGILKKVEEILHDRPEELSEVLRRLEKEHQQLQAGIPAPSTAPAKQTGPNR